jgi:hypothetical protein
MYTKGPWRLSESNTIWGVDEEFIADVFDTHNGRLIAAAPELLEALEKIADTASLVRGEINDQDTGWYYHLVTDIQKAMKAINKAKGVSI